MRVRASVGVMTTETITLIWPTADLINLNAERTWHHQRRARMVRAIRAEVAAMAADLHRFDGQVTITARFRWHDARRRDTSNLLPTIKAAVDGLVDAGVLPDDSDRYVRAVTIAGDVDGGITRGYAAMTLTVEEVAG